MQVHEFTTPLSERLGLQQVRERLRREFRDPSLEVVVKRSIDARGEPRYRYRCEIYPAGEGFADYELPEYRDVHNAEEVVVFVTYKIADMATAIFDEIRNNRLKLLFGVVAYK